MSLHPQARAFLQQMEAIDAPELHTVAVDVARTMYDKGAEQVRGEPPTPFAIDTLQIPGPAGALESWLYRPEDTPDLPLLVFFHGGGFTIGSLQSHDAVCRHLCVEAGCLVLSVDYRLGPEHRYPAAVDDAWAATRWALANAAAIGADPQRIGVGGDSAGGNLAAVVCLQAREAGLDDLVLQLLIYPATDMSREHPSHSKFASGYRLTRELIDWFYDNYVAPGADIHEWRASPINAASHRGLPPAFVLSAGFDPLQDENKAYALKLEADGVPVTYRHYGDMFHGFITMPGVLDRAREALAESAEALRGAFFCREPQ
ncbi:MAG: alpha/beta hydrolase [Pseudohongiellaceae bacterium]